VLKYNANIIRKFSREINSLSDFLLPYIPMPEGKGFTARFGKANVLYLQYTYYKGIFMISVRLDQKLEKELEEIAKITNRPKSFFIKEALKEYLEDIKDILEAKERISDPKRELIALDELKRELDV